MDDSKFSGATANEEEEPYVTLDPGCDLDFYWSTINPDTMSPDEFKRMVGRSREELSEAQYKDLMLRYRAKTYDMFQDPDFDKKWGEITAIAPKISPDSEYDQIELPGKLSARQKEIQACKMGQSGSTITPAKAVSPHDLVQDLWNRTSINSINQKAFNNAFQGMDSSEDICSRRLAKKERKDTTLDELDD